MAMIVKLDPEKVKQAFADAQDQADYLIAIYRMVFPDWDAIASIQRWPACNDTTWKSICRMAMDFDKAHHPYMPGGLWMNNGFCGADPACTLADWEVDTSTCNVVYKTQEQPCLSNPTA